MKKRWLLLLPAGGVLMALCLVLPKIGFLQWFVMIPALLLLFGHIERSQPRLRRLYGLGLLYFYPFYLVTWHWFIDLYPMEFAEVTEGTAVLLIAICWLGLSLLQAVFSALSFPVFGALLRTRWAKQWRWLTPVVFAAVYTVFEWTQTLTWAGVPWGRLALGQAECGILFNSAALFGSYFITFALVAVNGFAAWAILHLDRVRLAAIAAACVFLLNLGAGVIGYATARGDEGEPIKVAAVQANLGSHSKWENQVDSAFRIYTRHVAQAAAEGADLILLPETFIPARIASNSQLGVYVSWLAETYDVTLICGGFYHAEGEEYNALFMVYPDGTISKTVYCKQRLVPFGEFVPMRTLVETLVPPLADIGMLSEDLAAGSDTAIMESEAARIGGLICFDSIYENLTLDAVRDGAELICLATNDSWFLDSAGVYMHHAQARLRAIESGRYIVRSADTGISSVITPDGESLSELAPLVAGNSVAEVYARSGRTLYSYIGNGFVYLLMAALLALPAHTGAVALWRRRLNHTSAED